MSPAGVPTPEAATKAEAVMIKPVKLCGKTVSCISRKDGKYTLIEAVCKVFFPGTLLQEFLYAIKNILEVPIRKLSNEEELAFLNFYELPPTAGGLSCISAINIKHFDEIIPGLRILFGGPPISQEIPQAALKRSNQDSNRQTE